MIIIFEFATLDKLELTPYLHIFGNFGYGISWHAGILELWHTIESELNLNLRNGFKRVKLVEKDILNALKVKI